MSATRPDELVNELRSDLSKVALLADLERAIDSIPIAVEKWWRNGWQNWFTDHGPEHSHRVAETALELASATLSKLVGLNEVERFVLWAAAWLHDMGMQMLADCKIAPEEMSSEQMDRVRHQHPLLSARKITEDAVGCGLPTNDPDLTDLIGLVAKGHGTKFYRDVVQALPEKIRVRRSWVRPRLLTALLLLADELDLDYVRARPPSGEYVESPLSEAHRFKHRCVSDCHIGVAESGELIIHLSLTFPIDLSDSSQALVERWIVQKLQRQIGMVEEAILSGSGHQLRMDRNVRVEYKRPQGTRKVPSLAAIEVIRAEIAESNLINHRAALDQVKDAIRTQGISIIVGRLSGVSNQIDEDGREDVLRAATAFASAVGMATRTSSCLLENGGGSLSDVLYEWAETDSPRPPLSERENIRREALLTEIEKLVAAQNKGESLVFTAANLDALSMSERDWLGQHVVRRIVLASSGTVHFIFTAGGEGYIPTENIPVSSVPVGPLSPADVIDFLTQVIPRNEAQAVPHTSLSYAIYLGLYQRKLALVMGQ